MKRTTVKIPDDVDALLSLEAVRRHTTVSAVTRDAIETYLGVRGQRRLHAPGAGDSGRTDVSERVEEILQKKLASPGIARR